MFATGRALSIWSVLCIALALGSAALPQPAASPVAFPLRALHIAGNWGTNELVVEDWHAGRTDSLVPADYLAWLRYLNVNWVGISVALTYDDSMDSTVERNRAPAAGEDASFSDAALRQMIREFRRHGIDVYLTLAFETYAAENAARPAPRRLLGDPGGADGVPCCGHGIAPESWPWRADHPDHARFVGEFWETYTQEAVHVATLAEEEGVRMFSLGTETDRLFRTRPGGHFANDFGAELRSMVDRVRTVYSGLLTYDMHYSVLLDPGFFGPGLDHLWNDLDLDVVGVSAWFPLTDAPPATVMSVEQAQAQYEQIFNEHLVPLAARNPGRPIVFLEYGALDQVETPAAPEDPAEFPRFVFQDANGNGVDDGRETQANVHAGLLGAMDQHPGLVNGVFWWGNWMASDQRWRQFWANVRTHAIRAKPSEAVVRAAYRTYALDHHRNVLGGARLTELREAGTPASPPPRSPTSYYAQIPPTVIEPGYSPQAFFSSSADLNGDGNEDLIILGTDYPWFTQSTLSTHSPMPGRVYLGDGDGGFTPAPSELFPVDTLKTVHPIQVLFGDLNGDERLDMFVSTFGWDREPWPGEQNRLYLSRPGGGWRDATDELPQLSERSHSSAIGDIRGRGVLDIIVGNGYGGESGPYALLNDGNGSFVVDRAILPDDIGAPAPGHHFGGTVLTDLDGDGLPELILTGEDTFFPNNPNSTIFWNRSGAFSQSYKTVLPTPRPFVDSHIALHAASIDADGDGVLDLIVVGTQYQPYYHGWFVQLLMNQGDGTFIDETSSRLRPDEWFGGRVGEETRNLPWPQRVEVLDFNVDGVPDFRVRFNDGPGPQWPQELPLVWLNDGRGRFAALKAQDFVSPGDEWPFYMFFAFNRDADGSLLWRFTSYELMKTRHGYSFIKPVADPRNDGLVVTGLLATRPYP